MMVLCFSMKMFIVLVHKKLTARILCMSVVVFLVKNLAK